MLNKMFNNNTKSNTFLFLFQRDSASQPSFFRPSNMQIIAVVRE